MYIITKRCAFLGLFLFMTASTALAHGPYPRTQAIDINAEGQMLMTASFGLLRSDDQGQSWSWTCMESLGFDVDDGPTVFAAIGNDGSLHAASAFGLYGYRNCLWSQPAELDADFHSALVRDPGSDALWTVTSNASGQNFVYQSTDGQSWAPLGPPLPEALFEGLAVGTAGSNQVFVSAIEPATDQTPRRAVGLRLEDNAWVASPIADLESPVFAEVLTHRLPDGRPMVLALTDRSIGKVTQTLISFDQGESWESIAELDGLRVVDATWSADGQTLWAGGRAGAGLWESADGGKSFVQVQRDAEVSCLYERQGTLYVCGDHFVDGYIVGKSSDGGRNLEGVADFSAIVAELNCARSTQVGETCETPALDLQNDLAITLRPPDQDKDGCACASRRKKTNSFELLGVVFVIGCLTYRRRVTE